MAQVIHYVVSTSRAGVGGFATGVARGAFQEALRFALQTELGGRRLIEHEWARCILAEMYKNMALARLSYVETNYANSLYGMFKILLWKPTYYLMKLTPQVFFDRVLRTVLRWEGTTMLFRRFMMDGQRDEEIQRTSGWASLSKFAASDFGLRNCQLALELMGRAGVRHEMAAEKHLRDSKLLQIYEGTNQLNRLNPVPLPGGAGFPRTEHLRRMSGSGGSIPRQGHRPGGVGYFGTMMSPSGDRGIRSMRYGVPGLGRREKRG